MSENYLIPPPTKELAIVEFTDHAPFPPTDEEITELVGLVEKTQLIVVDLGKTISLGTRWIRLFADLTAAAEIGTRSFLLAGMGEAIRDTTDSIAQRDHLRIVASVAEAIES